MEKILVCAAWPYANGPIHLGHVAGSLLPPDIFARYHRLRGHKVLMVSGSDMHGTPITIRAEKEKVAPEVIAERYHAVNAKAIADLGISFDLFTSTHTKNHEQVTQDFFLRLLKHDRLVKRATDQYYCLSCKRFLPDRYVEGECPRCHAAGARGDQCDSCGETLSPGELLSPLCQLCGTAPQLRKTDHYFLKLSDAVPALRAWIADKAHWRPSVRQFTENWLSEGLEDRAITRDLTWGIPVPLEGWEGKRIYVWFEAVIGYLSATKELSQRRNEPELWREFWEDPKTRHYYFLGKDNIIFHTIVWPSMLQGHGGLVLPHDVPANEFMNFGAQRFSKSRGVTVEIPDLLEHYSAEAIRYYLAANMPETRDTEFAWEDFTARANNELVATYGNYLHRVLSFVHKNFGSVPPAGTLAPADEQVLRQIQETRAEVERAIEACQFRRALKAILDLAQVGNQYFDAVAPWALVKTDRTRCGAALRVNLELVRALLILAHPFLPRATAQGWTYLGFSESLWSLGWERALTTSLPEGASLPKPVPLFAKIEVQTSSPFAAYEGVDIRVGKVVAVRDHPNAAKLFLFKVDVGREIQLVAGLKGPYQARDLEGRELAVVTNLQPAVLRGERSDGMLLAAESGDSVSVLSPQRSLPPGTMLRGGLELHGGTLSFAEFQELDLRMGELRRRGDEAAIEAGGTFAVQAPPEVGPGLVLVGIAGGRAHIFTSADGVPVVADRPMPPGAKVR